jgi:hypothetical protein
MAPLAKRLAGGRGTTTLGHRVRVVGLNVHLDKYDAAI